MQYAVGSLVPLLLVPHIVRVIGLEEFGHLAVLMAWGGYGAVVVQYAFHMTGPKRIMQLAAGESIEEVFIDIAVAKLLLLAFSVAMMALVAILSLPFASRSSIAWVLLFAAPIAAALNSSWFLQSQGHFLWICLIAILGSLLTLYLGFSCVTKDSGNALDFAVIASIFSAIFMGIGTLAISIFSIGRTSYKWNVRKSINAIRDGWLLFISQFISILYAGSGAIVINYILGPKAAGSYSATERIINALMSAALLTHTAAYPRLASAYKNSRCNYFKMLKLIIVSYVSVTSVTALLAWHFRVAITAFLYGEVNDDSYHLLFFGLAWLILGIFGTALTGYLTVSNKGNEVWPLTLKILMASIGLGVVGIYTFGNAGWLAGLVASQSIVLLAGFRNWRNEHAK